MDRADVLFGGPRQAIRGRMYQWRRNVSPCSKICCLDHCCASNLRKYIQGSGGILRQGYYPASENNGVEQLPQMQSWNRTEPFCLTTDEAQLLRCPAKARATRIMESKWHSPDSVAISSWCTPGSRRALHTLKVAIFGARGLRVRCSGADPSPRFT